MDNTLYIGKRAWKFCIKCGNRFQTQIKNTSGSCKNVQCAKCKAIQKAKEMNDKMEKN